MIRLEEWVDIVALHRQGHGIKTTARRLGISRNAVRRALRRGGPPVYERARRPSKLDPFKDYLIQRLTDFPELSGERLLGEIRARGYLGGRRYLRISHWHIASGEESQSCALKQPRESKPRSIGLISAPI